MGDIYDEFVRKAAVGRKMAPEKLKELATGRVWTGQGGKGLGLVDALGGLKEAFDLAAEKAGIKDKDPQPVILPREKNFLEMLLTPGAAEFRISDFGFRISISNQRSAISSLSQVFAALTRENVLTLMPYFVEVR
jgi:protease-4